MMPGDRDLSDEVNRLKRRLERERKARIEAETIAERGLREPYTKQQQLEFVASHDPLTGLPNRRQFHTEIARLASLADRKSKSFALLLIDLDCFKQINDNLGHDAGDELLVEAGRRMQLTVRLPDCVCRLGGDEFAIMIDDLPCSEADCEAQDGVAIEAHHRVEAVCAWIVNGFAAPVEFNGAQMKTSASIGAALYRKHGSTPEALYKASDIALYEAKRAGKDTWRWNQEREPVKAQACQNSSTKSIHPPSITPPHVSVLTGLSEGA